MIEAQNEILGHGSCKKLIRRFNKSVPVKQSDSSIESWWELSWWEEMALWLRTVHIFCRTISGTIYYILKRIAKNLLYHALFVLRLINEGMLLVGEVLDFWYVARVKSHSLTLRPPIPPRNCWLKQQPLSLFIFYSVWLYIWPPRIYRGYNNRGSHYNQHNLVQGLNRWSLALWCWRPHISTISSRSYIYVIVPFTSCRADTLYWVSLDI